MKILSAFVKLSPEAKQRILDAAASAFAQEGYHYASIANICLRAGISNGALYKYFENKEDLFYAVLDCSTVLVEGLYQKNFINSKSLFTSVENYLNDLITYALEHKDYSCIYCDLGSSSMNRFAARAAEKYKHATSDYTIHMVRESKLRGEISSKISTSQAAYMIDTYITCFSYMLVSDYQGNRFHAFFNDGGEPLSSKEMVTEIISTLKTVLCAS